VVSIDDNWKFDYLLLISITSFSLFKKFTMKKIFALIVICSFTFLANAQQDNVSELNAIINTLIGEQDNLDIPVFKNLDEACNSSYISCNSKNEIIGLDFQFASLNGIIPQEITKLKKLNWINFEYNYLSGVIPEGLENLKELEQVLLNGNFLKGPIPAGLKRIKKSTLVDLSQNVIEFPERDYIERFNIVDQVNLQGCRSPDSIYISKRLNTRNVSEQGEILIDVDSIQTEIETDKSSDNPFNNNDIQNTYKVVQTMPRFPGCEFEDLDIAQKTECAQRKMLEFIFTNLKYPASARANNSEGMAVLQFTVLKDGDIGDVTLLKDPGDRMGNSGQWIVNRMNYICKKWSPGIQDGKPVKVLYTLPIKFKLN